MIIRTFRKYTPALRERILQELEDGTLSSYAAANRKYGIKGEMTIRRWIEKSGKTNLLHKFEVIDL